MQPRTDAPKRVSLLTTPILRDTVPKESPGKRFDFICKQEPGKPKHFKAALFRLVSGLLLFIFLFAALAGAHAQDGLLAQGDAVVTGFSGIRPSDDPVPPGGDPLDEFLIDLDGPSALILSLAAPGDPPQGQLISAPPKLQIKAGQAGQVFAVALDDGFGAKVPNIYLGAASAYGLHIVLPDADGDGRPERVKTGHPNAEWMPGQFGAEAGGGPGSIWRVDGKTGAVSLFATLPGNSGPGVGDVVFDKDSRQFFASDLDNGLIYRIGEDGAVIDKFDHGVDGRPAKGLAPAADDGKTADIKNPAFDTEKPETWGYSPDERRVHGLAVQAGRLYYAVDGQVWSVGVSSDGFAEDARWELDADALPGDGPITDMLLDKQGRLYLAQRGKPLGSYDYSRFAEPEKSAVVRYMREEPDDPATESAWVPEPEEYAIGLPPEHRRAEGGIALGLAHDESGALRHGACGEMLWSTGHRLRPGALAEDGEEAAEADVHGLQGNAISLVRPENVPPQKSYFADYDSFFGDAAKSGHVGDVEIWQPCEDAPDFADYTPDYGELPPGFLPPGELPPELPPEFPPDFPFETNLRLTKWAMPKTCVSWGPGWLCLYTVRIRNMGPDVYAGPLMVSDALPAAPAGALMGFANTPPWNCWATGPAAYRCLRPVVLFPGASVDLKVAAYVPKTYEKCHLVNGAAIEWGPGGSQWNTNPADDADFAVAHIPAKHCDDDPKRKSNLKIKKTVANDSFCQIGGAVDWCNVFRITVTNTGPDAFNGLIQVTDIAPAGLTVSANGAGWACVGATCVTNPAVTLQKNPPSTDDASFTVVVSGTAAEARELGCKLTNKAKIDAPLGGPNNILAADDTDQITVDLPEKFCKEPKTNLKIEKRASPKQCEQQGNDWWCTYQIRVINTGPGDFNGPIEVEEALPAEPLDANWNAPWTCQGTGGAGAVCKHPVTAMAPNNSKVLTLKIKFSNTVVKDKGCKLPNVAKIKRPVPGSPKNTNAGDDIAGDTALVPEKFCEKEQANLELQKYGAQPQCNIEGGKWRCPYGVIVKNTGPGNYKGKIVVKDWLPAAASGATMAVLAPWVCEGNAPAITCTHPYVELNPAQQVLMQVFAYVPPSTQLQCSLLNTARILQAPGGSVQNQNAGDDEDSATLQFPPLLADGQAYCTPPEPIKPCPPGFEWTGDRCVRIGIVPPPPPPSRDCPAGFTGNYPNCKRIVDPAPECPRGTVGKYPNCRKIVDPKPECPEGTIGRYPNCRKIVDGTPDCTGGRILRGGRCICPGRRIWDGQRCVLRVCPPGTRGVFPNCRKIVVDPPRQCPKGTIGRFPNCRKIVIDPPRQCPKGTVGRFPNCRPVVKVCPPGMVGRPPRCRKINSGGSNIPVRPIPRPNTQAPR